MGVPCPGCGREYDVTLFEYGRTIHCTCGERVGLQPRVRAPDEEPTRFLADAMLGGLTRWLRMLGFDCAHDPEIEDDELVRRSLDERRILLTRDRDLPEEWRMPGIHLISARGTLGALREVILGYGLAGRIRLFSRCSRCNAELSDVEVEEVFDRVPERVLERHDDFRRCPRCDRVYWAGSHTDEIRRIADEIRESASSEPS